MHDITLRNRAISLREEGQSIKQIAATLSVAVSTISLWVRETVLDERALARIGRRKKEGQTRGVEANRKKWKRRDDLIDLHADSIVSKSMDAELPVQLIAACLYWCEGEKWKTASMMRFTNSDPSLIQAFLWALRRGFSLDEKKFHVLVHLHPDHDKQETEKYWSDLTGIPLTQFYKSFQKPAGIRSLRSSSYKGCVSVRYSDATLVKWLESIYHAFAKRIIAK